MSSEPKRASEPNPKAPHADDDKRGEVDKESDRFFDSEDGKRMTKMTTTTTTRRARQILAHSMGKGGRCKAAEFM